MNNNGISIVYGEGSNSVYLTHELIKRGEQVVWLSGSGSRILPITPSVKSELGLAAISHALEGLPESELLGQARSGICHRVFKNKAFKVPNAKKGIEELYWKPEQAILSFQEYQFENLNPVLIEEKLRTALEGHPQVSRIAGEPIVEFEVFSSGGKLQLSNGFVTEFNHFYFCDDVNELRAVPKLAPVFKNQLGSFKASDRMSVLQVIFNHAKALNQSITQAMVIPMNREAGESFDRSVIGYFIEPKRSVWTVFLQSDEGEENHEIMKKLRKLKQTLNRAFEGNEFLPEGYSDFMATVINEQVRFEPNCFIPNAAIKLSNSNPDFVLMSDSFGFSESMERLAHYFGMKPYEVAAHFEDSSLDLNHIEVQSNRADDFQASV